MWGRGRPWSEIRRDRCSDRQPKLQMRSQLAVTVAIGDFGIGALGGGLIRDPSKLSCSLLVALRYYLADEGSGRVGWRYPLVGRDQPSKRSVEVRFEVDEMTWRNFSAEAERQGVSPDRLLQHAVLYFAASRDGGRIADRIAN
jgi:hypothetical protein